MAFKCLINKLNTVNNALYRKIKIILKKYIYIIQHTLKVYFVFNIYRKLTALFLSFIYLMLYSFTIF